MGNKSMLTNRYNRKMVNGKLCLTSAKSTNDVNNDVNGSNDSFKYNKHFTNPITSASIRPDKPYTYKKPNLYKPSIYTDVYKTKHYVKQFGGVFYEIPKAEYRTPSIELKQFAILVKTACNVLASINGHVSIKEVKGYLLEHEFVILDNKLLSDVVKSFLSDKPHLKKRVSHNRVKHNSNDYGYSVDAHYHKSWYDREHWAKLMGICEL